MSKPTVTTAAFERSHNKKPRGKGYWYFAASRTGAAYDRDLHPTLEFFEVCASYGAARRLAQEHFATYGVRHVAVLP